MSLLDADVFQNTSELAILAIVITSLTILLSLSKITSEQYMSTLQMLLAYIFGRVLNHKDGKVSE